MFQSKSRGSLGSPDLSSAEFSPGFGSESGCPASPSQWFSGTKYFSKKKIVAALAAPRKMVQAPKRVPRFSRVTEHLSSCRNNLPALCWGTPCPDGPFKCVLWSTKGRGGWVGVCLYSRDSGPPSRRGPLFREQIVCVCYRFGPPASLVI